MSLIFPYPIRPKLKSTHYIKMALLIFKFNCRENITNTKLTKSDRNLTMTRKKGLYAYSVTIVLKRRLYRHEEWQYIYNNNEI